MRRIEGGGSPEIPREIKEGRIEKPSVKNMPTEASRTELSKVQKLEVEKAVNKCVSKIGHAKVICATLSEMLKTEKNISE